MTKKKTTKKAGNRRPKPKQARVPGTEQPVHKDIIAAAENYVDARDERMTCTKQEVEAKEKLMKLMKKHECSVYDYEDSAGEPMRAELTEVAESVKVKKRRIEVPEAAE